MPREELEKRLAAFLNDVFEMDEDERLPVPDATLNELYHLIRAVIYHKWGIDPDSKHSRRSCPVEFTLTNTNKYFRPWAPAIQHPGRIYDADLSREDKADILLNNQATILNVLSSAQNDLERNGRYLQSVLAPPQGENNV